MQNTISDSELQVNRARLLRIRINHTGSAKLADMAAISSNRDDAISGYVRLRIREWEESGRELQELSRVAGFGKSTPSQVKRGTGVGAKTGPGFARAFGFKDFDALKSAAYAWWQTDGAAHAAAVDLPHTEPMREAIEAVLLLNQGTRSQLETILSAYAHRRFHDRDREWWIQVLLSELSRDRQTLKDDKVERVAATAGQKVFREANRQKSLPSVHKPVPRRKLAGD